MLPLNSYQQLSFNIESSDNSEILDLLSTEYIWMVSKTQAQSKKENNGRGFQIPVREERHRRNGGPNESEITRCLLVILNCLLYTYIGALGSSGFKNMISVVIHCAVLLGI